MLRKELRSLIEEGMEDGTINKNDLNEFIPPCKSCTYKAIGMIIMLPIIGVIVGYFIF